MVIITGIPVYLFPTLRQTTPSVGKLVLFIPKEPIVLEVPKLRPRRRIECFCIFATHFVFYMGYSGLIDCVLCKIYL